MSEGYKTDNRPISLYGTGGQRGQVGWNHGEVEVSLSHVGADIVAGTIMDGLTWICFPLACSSSWFKYGGLTNWHYNGGFIG